MLSILNCAIIVLGLLMATGDTALGADKPKDPPATSASPKTAPPTERVVGPLSQADAAALATMNARLKEYIDLHVKLEKTLPTLSKEATPEQIDKQQRAFEILIRNARTNAKVGDIFTPQARAVINRLLANVFKGAEGRQLKASIMDENPVDVALTINGRYPDNVPLSTMPPQVLQTLPQLSNDLEYRFLSDRIILLDTQAHLVVDYIDKALPK